MKPGYQTSEFWITIASILVGLGINCGIINPAAKDSLLSNINALVGGAIALITPLSWIISRTWLKAKTPAEVKNG